MLKEIYIENFALISQLHILDRGGREIRRQGEKRPEEESRLYRDDLRVYLHRESRDGSERCADG